MNSASRKAASSESRSGEPRALKTPVPIWLFVALIVFLYLGMVYFDSYGAWFNPLVYEPFASIKQLEDNQPPPPSGPDLAKGRKAFENNCALCHNIDGTGRPGQAPPFVKSEWAHGPATRMIRIPQNGLAGPIKVNGQVWNQVPSMAAMGVALSDEDLANVLSYIRTSWGNTGSPVTPEQVSAVRAEVGSRTQPWTEDELNKVPEK
jgi:mono/diheme cytochrome c family protein